METTITLAQAIGFSITILVIIIGAYISMRINVARLDERVKVIRESHDVGNAKIEKIFSILTEIKVQIARISNNNK